MNFDKQCYFMDTQKVIIFISFLCGDWACFGVLMNDFHFSVGLRIPQIWIFKKWKKNFLTILRVSNNFVVTEIPLCTNTYQSKCTYFILQITCTLFDRVPSPILYIFGFVVGDYHRFHDFFFLPDLHIDWLGHGW